MNVFLYETNVPLDPGSWSPLTYIVMEMDAEKKWSDCTIQLEELVFRIWLEQKKDRWDTFGVGMLITFCVKYGNRKLIHCLIYLEFGS